VNQLSESKKVALKRLYSLERKLNTDPELKLAYTWVMQEYIDSNHMFPIGKLCNVGFYMPHHAVVRLQVTRRRFDLMH